MKLRIFAICEDGSKLEIKDLYWFEESGVHNFDDCEGSFGEKYKFLFLLEPEEEASK